MLSPRHLLATLRRIPAEPPDSQTPAGASGTHDMRGPVPRHKAGCPLAKALRLHKAHPGGQSWGRFRPKTLAYEQISEVEDGF